MKFPFLKEALSNVVSKPSTVRFPAVNVDAKPDYRGRIAYDPEKCVNCGSCIKVCSPQAITRTYEDVEGGQKITYEFDLTFAEGETVTPGTPLTEGSLNPHELLRIRDRIDAGDFKFDISLEDIHRELSSRHIIDHKVKQEKMT